MFSLSIRLGAAIAAMRATGLCGRAAFAPIAQFQILLRGSRRGRP
jgi:hypothetical protein